MPTIKFEHIDQTAHDEVGSPIADLYGGFHWQAILAIKTSALPADNGYKVGTHSGHSAAYNDPSLGIDQAFSCDVSFTLKSAWLAALSGPADIKFTAFADGVEVGHKTFHLGTGDDLFEFGGKFKHITSVTIDSGDTQVVMDDLKVIFDDEIPGLAAHHAVHDVADGAAQLGTGPLHHGADLWALC